MDEDLPLKVTHDVSQTLQRKLEGKSHQLHPLVKGKTLIACRSC
jgi:hypothetical protein